MSDDDEERADEVEERDDEDDADEDLLDEADEDDEDDEQDDGTNAVRVANAYFAAQRNPRRAQRLAANKKRLCDLPGGGPQELASAVHELLRRPSSLPAETRERHARSYPEWLAMLHGGFSLLLHGFGSKKELLEDFASGLDGPETPVLVLQGYTSGARLRELLVLLLTQVLKTPATPTGTTRALCNQVRQAFRTAAAPPAAPAAPQGVGLQHFLRLLPTAAGRPNLPPALAYVPPTPLGAAGVNVNAAEARADAPAGVASAGADGSASGAGAGAAEASAGGGAGVNVSAPALNGIRGVTAENMADKMAEEMAEEMAENMAEEMAAPPVATPANVGMRTLSLTATAKEAPASASASTSASTSLRSKRATGAAVGAAAPAAAAPAAAAVGAAGVTKSHVAPGAATL